MKCVTCENVAVCVHFYRINMLLLSSCDVLIIELDHIYV